MSKKTNFIDNALVLIITVASVFLVVLLCNSKYGGNEIFQVILLLLAGAVIFGLINAFAHEFGHIIAGKRNGFKFVSMSVWFFKWTKVRGKIIFDFVMMGEEAGSSEMITDCSDNIAKRFKKMTEGGIIASGIMTVIGAVPLFLTAYLPMWAFCMLSVMFPVGIYYFFGNVLPMSSEGVLNDGATVLSLSKNTDSAKVLTSVLSVQAEIASGKTPSEVDEKFYFEVPQIPEDDLNFILLLNARYYYYLDKGDTDNAKKTSDRLMTLLDYMPKSYQASVKVDALYNACTFDYNEDTADELMYEVEKYINNLNNATNVRVKLAYLLYVAKRKDSAEVFYEKGLRECRRCALSGFGKFEQKFLERLKKDF